MNLRGFVSIRKSVRECGSEHARVSESLRGSLRVKEHEGVGGVHAWVSERADVRIRPDSYGEMNWWSILRQVKKNSIFVNKPFKKPTNSIEVWGLINIWDA